MAGNIKILLRPCKTFFFKILLAFVYLDVTIRLREGKKNYFIFDRTHRSVFSCGLTLHCRSGADQICNERPYFFAPCKLSLPTFPVVFCDTFLDSSGIWGPSRFVSLCVRVQRNVPVVSFCYKMIGYKYSTARRNRLIQWMQSNSLKANVVCHQILIQGQHRTCVDLFTIRQATVLE